MHEQQLEDDDFFYAPPPRDSVVKNVDNNGADEDAPELKSGASTTAGVQDQRHEAQQQTHQNVNPNKNDDFYNSGSSSSNSYYNNNNYRNNNQRKQQRRREFVDDDLRAHLKKAGRLNIRYDKNTGGSSVSSDATKTDPYADMVMTPTLEEVIYGIANSCARVATEVLRENSIDEDVPSNGESVTNSFGDEQLPVDRAADNIIAQTLIRTPGVASYASEEVPRLRRTRDTALRRWLLKNQKWVSRRLKYQQDANDPGESAENYKKPAITTDPDQFYQQNAMATQENLVDVNDVPQYCVTFDPLDGSSIIENNFAVGSIFGVWHGDKGPLTENKTLRESIAASVVAVYGPRTTLFVGLPEHLGGLQEFALTATPRRQHSFNNSSNSDNKRGSSSYRPPKFHFQWKLVTRGGDDEKSLENQPAAVASDSTSEDSSSLTSYHHQQANNKQMQQQQQPISKTSFSVAKTAKFFSPGNLRTAVDFPAYKKFISELSRQKLTLRYTGGMVPDVMQILIKGSGIFSYPIPHQGTPKLRTLFECAPIAHMLELAGAVASDGRAPFYTPRLKKSERREIAAKHKEHKESRNARGQAAITLSTAGAQTTRAETQSVVDGGATAAEFNGEQALPLGATTLSAAEKRRQNGNKQQAVAPDALRYKDAYYFRESSYEKRLKAAANLTKTEQVMIAKEHPELYSSFLDKYVTRVDDRTPFVVGSADAVGRLVRLMTVESEVRYLWHNQYRVQRRIKQFDRRIEALEDLIAQRRADPDYMPPTARGGAETETTSGATTAEGAGGGNTDDDQITAAGAGGATLGGDTNTNNNNPFLDDEASTRAAIRKELDETNGRITEEVALDKIFYINNTKQSWLQRKQELEVQIAAWTQLESIEDGLSGSFIHSIEDDDEDFKASLNSLGDSRGADQNNEPHQRLDDDETKEEEENAGGATTTLDDADDATKKPEEEVKEEDEQAAAEMRPPRDDESTTESSSSVGSASLFSSSLPSSSRSSSYMMAFASSSQSSPSAPHRWRVSSSSAASSVHPPSVHHRYHSAAAVVDANVVGGLQQSFYHTSSVTHAHTTKSSINSNSSPLVGGGGAVFTLALGLALLGAPVAAVMFGGWHRGRRTKKKETDRRR